MRPKLLLLKSVFGAPQITRLNRLNASMRTSISRPAALDRLADAQVLGQIPEAAHVAVDARRIAQLANRLHECSAVQESVDYRIELGAGNRCSPVRPGNVRTVCPVEDVQRRIGRHANGQPAAVCLDERDAPAAGDVTGNPASQPAAAGTEGQLEHGVDLDVVWLVEPADRPFQLGACRIHRPAAAAEAVGVSREPRVGVARLHRHAACQPLIHLHDAGMIVRTAGLVAAAALRVHREVLRIRTQCLSHRPGALHVRIGEVGIRRPDPGGHRRRGCDLRVEQVARSDRAEPCNQIVHDGHRHLIRVEQARLQFRSVDTVVFEVDGHAFADLALHRDRPVVVLSRTAGGLTVEPVDVVVVRERRIDQRRQRIGGKPLIQIECRRDPGIGRPEYVLTDETGEVTAALSDGHATEGAADPRPEESFLSFRL